jgi:hypothetical protein
VTTYQLRPRGTMSQSKWRRLVKWSPAYVAEAKERAKAGFVYNHPHSNPRPIARGEGWPK